MHKPVKISEAFELYRVDYIVPKNQSIKTEENHIICMRSLLKHFGDIDIEQLDRLKIREWRTKLSTTRSSDTVRNYVIKLRVVLEYLRKEGYNVVDPDNIPVPQRAERIVKHLTPDQVQLFIDACKSGKKITRARNRAIISLIYSSGIRVSEVCKLNRADINGRNYFTVHGKGGIATPSFIDHRTQVYLMSYMNMRKDNNPALFVNEKGLRVRPLNIQETFCTLSNIVGIKATPHTLKHSFCTNLMNNGADIRHVQRLAKHKSILTTQQYLHVVDKDLQRLHRQFHSV